jgi:flavin-dependent dehydrogenase
MNNTRHDGSHFDVVICGAGLAGMGLARQLRIEQPDLTIALLDPQVPPFPDAAWKIGESTVEFGSHYLADYIQLKDNLEEKHLKKLGLRFFYPSQGKHADRPELGLSNYAPFMTYQIDRGILETDMREMARNDGTVLMEGCQVRRVDIGQGDTPHSVVFTDVGGGDATITCRWVVDATGRRQLLQRQLKLRIPHQGTPCSSAWFRLAGRRDVDDLAPADNKAWHDRVPDRIRYFSTNHLVDRGYWVWIIPLSSDITSIGIVTRNDIFPFEEYNTYEKALDWLKRNEPEFAAYIGDAEPVDFRAMKEYSYSSERVFSSDRWACVGEAAVFADPFYSPGTDLIGIANTMACDMIRRDMAGELESGRVDYYSNYLIELNDELTRTIQHGYDYLGDEMVSLARGIWDYSAAWGHLCPLLINRAFTDDAKQAAMQPRGMLPLFVIAVFMRRLMDEWLKLRQEKGGRLTYDYIDYLGIPWLFEHRERNLEKQDSIDALSHLYRGNIELFEELLQALFLLAVDDVCPEAMPRLDDIEWMNVQRLTLDPSKWDTSGMFKPRTAPRKFRHLYESLRAQVREKDAMPPEALRVAAM